MFQAMFYSKQQDRNTSRSYENDISESEQNNSQLWRVQTVDKDIMSLSTVLNSNLAHTAQVLTIKQQCLAKDCISFGCGSLDSFTRFTAKIRLQQDRTPYLHLRRP